jgi:hypothetical protein
VTLRHGQFLEGLAMRESTNNYAYVNANNGAAGRYSILPGSWAEWCGQYWGELRDIMVPANQESLTAWRTMRYYTKARRTYPAEPVLMTYQRVAASWRNGASYGLRDPATWSDGVRTYLRKLGVILRDLGYASWAA